MRMKKVPLQIETVLKNRTGKIDSFKGPLKDLQEVLLDDIDTNKTPKERLQ